jgi:Xaa-Pro aminopeptidase
VTELDRIPEAEFGERRARAAAAASAEGYDGLLVVGRSSGTLDSVANVFWLTHHYFVPPIVPPTGPWRSYGRDFVLLDGDARAALVTVGSSQEPAIDDVRCGSDLDELVVQAVRDLGLERGRLGLVGGEVLPWPLGARLAREFPELALEPADLLLARLRLTLSEAECAMVRQSTRIGSRILNAALAAAVVGATDGDVAAAGLGEAARTPETQHWNFIMASGERSLEYSSGALPSWDAATPYREGDLIHPDCFGYVDGYMYDLQRTRVVGAEPDRRQRRLMEGASEHARTLGAALQDGVTCRAIYELGVRFMEDRGYDHSRVAPPWQGGAHFGHGFASGFDWPWLGITAPGADLPLEAPFAVTIELWWGEPDVGAAWVEDNYLVLPDRVERLTADVPS